MYVRPRVCGVYVCGVCVCVCTMGGCTRVWNSVCVRACVRVCIVWRVTANLPNVVMHFNI